jgi:hypothetical protein
VKTVDSQLAALIRPGILPFTVTVAASLFAIFLLLLESGAPAAAAIPLLCGVAGLVLRWTAMPGFLVVTVGYFELFPLGVPAGPMSRYLSRPTYFQLDHLLLVAAVLVYLFAQLRLYLLLPGKAAHAERPEPTDPGEARRAAFAILGFVIVGQLLWMLVMNVELDVSRGFPLKWVESRPVRPNLEGNRFMILVAIFAAPALVCGLAFRVFRWYRLPPQEARLILLDEQWQALRRELARQETWRSFARGHDASARADAIRSLRYMMRASLVFVLLGSLLFFLYFFLTFGRNAP